MRTHSGSSARAVVLLAAMALAVTACKVEVPEKLANALAEKLSGEKSNKVKSGSSGSTREKKERSATVVDGIITVKAGGYHDYPVRVKDGMDGARLSGRFTASGGSGNDIVVLVLDQDAFVNWTNGHGTSALYNSGQTTTGSVSAWLSEPGTYHVVFSNRFSTLSSKDVTAEVNLKYESY